MKSDVQSRLSTLSVGTDALSAFPALLQTVHGRTLHYLDSAATALKPRIVIDAMQDYYSHYSANVHRGLHAMSEKATEKLESAREIVAKFINAQDPANIVFTSGTTESLNGIAQMLAKTVLKNDDEILVTQLDHHSNIIPWFQTSYTVRFVPVTDDGHVTTESVEQMISDKTKVLAVPMISNALGTTIELKPLIALAHAHGMVVVIDAAQGAVHAPVNVRDLECDFLAFSGHKLYGPTGIGVLYGRSEFLESLHAWKGGGGMIREVTESGFTASPPPAGFEAGTPHIAGAIGLAAAIQFVQHIGIESISRHEHELVTYTLQRLQSIPEVILYGPEQPEKIHSIVSFNVRGIHAHDVSAILDRHGVAIRSGHHCAQPLMKHLGIAGTARASLALYNTEKDIDALAIGIEDTIKRFA